jgi:hypothetical protein
MIDLENIHSLSDFQRDARRHIQRLKATGRPEVLTVNGRAELVVQDAKSYQKMLEYLETVKGIQRGLADARAGRTKPAEQVLKEMRRKLKIPRSR